MDSQVNVVEGPVVKLTAKALEAVKRTLASQNLEGHRLRIGLLPGGCAGFKYDLDVVREAQPGDLTLEQDGVGHPRGRRVGRLPDRHRDRLRGQWHPGRLRLQEPKRP